MVRECSAEAGQRWLCAVGAGALPRRSCILWAVPRTPVPTQSTLRSFLSAQNAQLRELPRSYHVRNVSAACSFTGRFCQLPPANTVVRARCLLWDRRLA